MAGGGPYEFLFDDLIPFVTAAGVLSMEIGVAPIGCHPWLTHTGGSILMRQAIEPGAEPTR
jgi:hypothetical protein